MPKIKTNRSATKRFKRTASGGLKRSHAFGAKNMTGKSGKRRRKLGLLVMTDSVDLRRVNKLMPYS